MCRSLWNCNPCSSDPSPILKGMTLIWAIKWLALEEAMSSQTWLGIQASEKLCIAETPAFHPQYIRQWLVWFYSISSYTFCCLGHCSSLRLVLIYVSWVVMKNRFMHFIRMFTIYFGSSSIFIHESSLIHGVWISML